MSAPTPAASESRKSATTPPAIHRISGTPSDLALSDCTRRSLLDWGPFSDATRSRVAIDKGCYLGQETVARVHTLGRPPRRLVLLHLDGSVDHLPPHGSDVVHGERTVGFVGSSALHHELGPVALALVKRNVPVDTQLLADGVAAAQEAVVDPEAGLHVRPQLR